MSFDLTNLDMNCNNCIHLERSLSKRQKHVDFHYKMQKDYFDTIRIKLLEKGEYHLKKSKSNLDKSDFYKEKAKNNFNEARKMKFVFDEGSCSLFYGRCSLKNVDVSFIPDTIMEENFNCFENRKKD
jgi:hypothetical protein